MGPGAIIDLACEKSARKMNEEVTMREHLEKLSGLVSAILFVASLAFVFVGIRLVYLGTAQSATVEVLDLQLPSGIVGKTSIAVGALGLMHLVRSLMLGIRDHFTFHGGPDGG
jgi:hypothetical protein